MQTLTATNNFHGTTAEVSVTKIYETETAPVAVVEVGEMRRAHKALCGHADCICTGPHALMDLGGRVYVVEVI